MKGFTAVVLAAGKGTRMKSELPKGLHTVCGIPMVELIGRALRDAGAERTIMVVGHQGDQVIETLGPTYEYAWQTEQKGTGHAALMALPLLDGLEGAVIVTPGDTPLLEAAVFAKLAEVHQANGNTCTVATAILVDATGYGRVVRGADGQAERIVEHKDADEAVRAIREVNAGIYCFDLKLLREVLPTLSNTNSQGEYYLTDVLAAMRAKGGRAEAVVFGEEVLMGVNDRWQLAEAAGLLRQRLLKKHALNGVTIVDPTTTYIEPDVIIAPDAVLEPGVILEGTTRIGAGCHLGPNTRITDSTLEEGCTVLMSHLSKATLLKGVRCGPFANLRPGTVLGEKVKIGNFVEVKNARLEESASVSHLSYIGDGSVGARANIGAGTIFCNYDGFNKHQTTVGADAFVGSNSTLVAPVTIGEEAIVGAGSVITRDVPAGSLAIGRSRQEVKEEWAKRWREQKRTAKAAK